MRENLQRLNWRNVFIAIFIVLVIIGLYFAFRKDSDHSTDKPTVSSSQQDRKKIPGSASSNGNTKSKQGAGPGSASGATPGTTQSGTSSSSSTGTQQSSQLANSGPGDTIAMFGIVTIIGTGAYHMVQRRRV